MPKPVYKRILLKLSGEALLGELASGIDFDRALAIAREIKDVHDMGVEIAIMIGGGNLFRGVKGTKVGIDQASADQMGMLGTVINGIALHSALEKEGAFARHISAIEIRSLAEPFIRRRAIRHLEKGRVIVFSAGIGSPFFTTDTAAAQRALEIHAEVILKATKVDGVYTADPMIDPKARKFKSIRYIDVLKKGLRVMDSTAISLCRDNNLPIVVFDLNGKDSFRRVVLGEAIGTKVF
ncbi:MAG: UMP kinase [Candidatus Aminicenantales bacterium]|jgi:uridylate kinase